METTKTEAMNNLMETSKAQKDISIPLQNLFDECLNFISVNDFNV
jgi:hypothetical protein